MPPLKKLSGSETVALPRRKAVLAGSTDVLVVGGGPSGISASIAASMAGCNVILAEQYGFLGGNATVALVAPLMSFHAHDTATEGSSPIIFFPADHGPSTGPVVGGILSELIERLIKEGGARPPSQETGFVVPFDHEIFKLVAMDMVDEYNIRVLLHAFASGCIALDNGWRVVFETKSGPLALDARIVVDCTGDADVAVQAGAQFSIGREIDNAVQPMTLYFRMTNFDRAPFISYVEKNKGQWHGVHGLWDLVKEASADGDLDLPRDNILFFGTPHDHEVSINSTRADGLGVDVWDLTKAEWDCRRQMRQIASFLRERVPGFRNAYVVQSGVSAGVRETRRIIGEYTLTVEDVLNVREFEDGIARCAYPIDIHEPFGKGTLFVRLPPGESYDIPLRCLLPKGVGSLLTAGRCISGTHEAHSSYRTMPTSFATGQAAGCCAALAVKKRTQPAKVHPYEVRELIRKQGGDPGTGGAGPLHASK
jgi:hypothetical protein